MKMRMNDTTGTKQRKKHTSVDQVKSKIQHPKQVGWKGKNRETADKE